MPFKFFHISVRASGPGETELNGFLGSHRVLAVDRRWVDQGADSFWSVCVDYMESSTTSEKQVSKPRGKDYKEILSPEDFAVFARLRDLRKELAQAESVPVYTIFTNEHLAQMVLTRAAQQSDLEKIAGVGEARIKKFGQRFVEFLRDQWPRAVFFRGFGEPSSLDEKHIAGWREELAGSDSTL